MSQSTEHKDMHQGFLSSLSETIPIYDVMNSSVSRHDVPSGTDSKHTHASTIAIIMVIKQSWDDIRQHLGAGQGHASCPQRQKV